MIDSTPTSVGHPDEATLNDFADHRLSATAHAAAEAHLSACDACRAALDGVRSVIALGKTDEARAAVPALQVQPPASLWPVVAATTLHERLVRRHVLRSMRGTLVVAALALAAASSATTVAVMELWQRGTELRANGPPRLPPLPSPRRRGGTSLDENLRAATQRKLAALASAERAAIRAVPPERQGALFGELATLDSALAATHDAALAGPPDGERMRVIEDIYRRREAMIQRAIQAR